MARNNRSRFTSSRRKPSHSRRPRPADGISVRAVAQWSAQPDKFWTAPLVLLIAIGAVFRLQYLNQPIRYDEAVTYVYFASGSWMHAIATYTYPNNHVFHTLLVKAAVALFGNSPWVLRLPAFFAGIAMMPVTFAIARRLYGTPEAYFATAVIAASGVLALYSTNARGYTMICLATLLLWDLLLRLRDSPSTRLWSASVLVIVLATWTIPIMLFPVAGLALWFFLSAISGDTSEPSADVARTGLAAVVSIGLTAVLYAPIVRDAGVDALTSNSFVRPSPWRVFFAQLPPSINAAFSSWALGLPLIIGGLLAACALAGALSERSSKAPRIPVLGGLYVASAILLLIAHHTPPPRVWLFLIGPVAILAGRGIVDQLRTLAWSRDNASRVGSLSVVFAGGMSLIVTLSKAVPSSLDTGTMRDAEAVTSRLSSLLRPGDAVIAPIPSNAPLAYYFLRQAVDTSHLSSPSDSAAATYLIVNTAEGYSLDTPVSDIRARKFQRARVIAHFAASDVYRLY